MEIKAFYDVPVPGGSRTVLLADYVRTEDVHLLMDRIRTAITPSPEGAAVAPSFTWGHDAPPRLKKPEFHLSGGLVLLSQTVPLLRIRPVSWVTPPSYQPSTEEAAVWQEVVNLPPRLIVGGQYNHREWNASLARMESVDTVSDMELICQTTTRFESGGYLAAIMGPEVGARVGLAVSSFMTRPLAAAYAQSRAVGVPR